MYIVISLILVGTWIFGLSINNLGGFVHVFLVGSIMSYGAHYLGKSEYNLSNPTLYVQKKEGAWRWILEMVNKDFHAPADKVLKPALKIKNKLGVV